MNGDEQRPPSTALVVTGFVFAVLLPIVGVVIGIWVMTRPRGTVVGLWIFCVSIAVMIGSYALLYA